MAKNQIKNLNEIKGIDKLFKSFDNVIHENLENHQTLELSNNVNKNGIDKVVYLKLNISYSGNGGRKAKECLEGAIEDLLPWLDLLLNHDEKENKNTNKQLSLFEDDISNDVEYEVEPETPSSEGNWDKYFRTCHRVRINNMKKDYSFFELFDPLTWWWAYHSFNYKKFIPTHEDLLQQVKDAILEYKDIGGRHDDVWFDNPKYVTSAGPLSDIELYIRVMGTLRLYLVPWKVHNGVFYDDSFTKHSDKGIRNSHLFYFDGDKLQLNYSSLKNYINTSSKQEYGYLQDELAVYDFYTPEFISFLRETLDVEEGEPLTDDSAKDILLKAFVGSINSEWEKILNNSKSPKDFKTKLFNNVNPKEVNFKHVSLTENYSFVMNLDKNIPYLRIEQRTITRKRLNYYFEENTDLTYWKYIVECIEGDEVYKLIHNKYKSTSTSNIFQTTLFDFMGAA